MLRGRGLGAGAWRFPPLPMRNGRSSLPAFAADRKGSGSVGELSRGRRKTLSKQNQSAHKERWEAEGGLKWLGKASKPAASLAGGAGGCRRLLVLLGFRTGWKEPNSTFPHACPQMVCVVRPLQGFLRFSTGCSETSSEPSTLLGNLFGAPAQPHGGYVHKTCTPYQSLASRKRRCADSVPALRRCLPPLAIPPCRVLIASGWRYSTLVATPELSAQKFGNWAGTIIFGFCRGKRYK